MVYFFIVLKYCYVYLYSSGYALRFLDIVMIKLMRLGWKVFLPLSLGWVVFVASVLLAIGLATSFKIDAKRFIKKL